MNFTALNNVTCTLVGDAWSAIETSADGANWATLAPNTPHAGANFVRMWLKGVTISGVAQAADANSAAYPELPGAANGYRIGLIQIIKKAPVMVARYEGYKYKRWLQKTIPFFDSDGVANSPWYNAGARADLAAGVPVQFQLQDYPTTTAAVRFDAAANAGRIEELHKALDFDVFVAVGPRTARYKQKGMRIVQHLTWTTETRVLFTWNAAGALSYTAPAFTRTATAVTVVNAAASQAHLNGFPGSAEGANDAISSMTLL